MSRFGKAGSEHCFPGLKNLVDALAKFLTLARHLLPQISHQATALALAVFLRRDSRFQKIANALERRITTIGQKGFQLFAILRSALFDDGQTKIILAGEVVIEQGDAHAGPRGDVAHGDGMEAPLIEERQRRLHDALLPVVTGRRGPA